MGYGIVVNMMLVPTNGNILSNLVGLCVDLIYHGCNVAVQVSLGWKCDNVTGDDAISHGNKLEGGRFLPWRRWIVINIMWYEYIQTSSYNNSIRGVGIS